jgi:hypothetical protein
MQFSLILIILIFIFTFIGNLGLNFLYIVLFGIIIFILLIILHFIIFRIFMGKVMK